MFIHTTEGLKPVEGMMLVPVEGLPHKAGAAAGVGEDQHLLVEWWLLDTGCRELGVAVCSLYGASCSVGC